jgi:thioredoxin 1
MSDVIKVNDGNFDAEVMKSQQPVLLDFSATWCGPCKQLEPLVEELAREYKGRLKVGSVDVEEAPNTSMRFGVISVPTLIIIKDGQVHGQQVGALPKTKLADWVARAF